MAPLKDFIPAGQSQGAVGVGGFSDFVPAPVPVMHPEVEPVLPEAKKPSKKAKKAVKESPVEALGEPEATVSPLGEVEPVLPEE